MKNKQTVQIKGQNLRCLFCGNEEFVVQNVMLNKTWASILDIEWLSNEGKAFICANCGYKHEFYHK